MGGMVGGKVLIRWNNKFTAYTTRGKMSPKEGIHKTWGGIGEKRLPSSLYVTVAFRESQEEERPPEKAKNV